MSTLNSTNTGDCTAVCFRQLSASDYGSQYVVQMNPMNSNAKYLFNKFVTQRTRDLFFRISVYKKTDNDVPIDEISGSVISGSYAFVGDSDTCRTFQITMECTSTKGKKYGSIDQIKNTLWLSEYCKFFVGVKFEGDEYIYWIPLGLGTPDGADWTYDAVTNQLSFQAVDMICFMDGTRGGAIPEYGIIVEQGESVSDAMDAFITKYVQEAQKWNFTKNIEECYTRLGKIQRVPNKIEKDAGITTWNVITELRDIQPCYRAYFDVNGEFWFSDIPFKEETEPLYSSEYIQPIVIQENESVQYSSVKNHIQVWGASQSVSDNFTGGFSGKGTITNYTTQGNEIYIDVTVDKWLDTTEEQQASAKQGLQGCFVVDFREYDIIGKDMYLKINSSEYYHVVYADQTLSMTHPQYSDWSAQKNIQNYVFYMFYEVVEEEDKFTFATTGQLQFFGEVMDNREDSPFSIDKIGDVPEVLSGGEYVHICSDNDCIQRAEWELYKKDFMQSTVQLKCVPNYLFGINHLVEYTSLKDGKSRLYLIKRVQCDLQHSGLMNLTLAEFQPYYN